MSVLMNLLRSLFARCFEVSDATCANRCIRILRKYVTSRGVRLPLQALRYLDFGGKYRIVYLLEGYVIDTFYDFGTYIISVGRLIDGVSVQGFISADADEKLAVLSFADHRLSYISELADTNMVYRSDCIRGLYVALNRMSKLSHHPSNHVLWCDTL